MAAVATSVGASDGEVLADQHGQIVTVGGGDVGLVPSTVVGLGAIDGRAGVLREDDVGDPLERGARQGGLAGAAGAVDVGALVWSADAELATIAAAPVPNPASTSVVAAMIFLVLLMVVMLEFPSVRAPVSASVTKDRRRGCAATSTNLSTTCDDMDAEAFAERPTAAHRVRSTAGS